jgi:hypothetical protein
MAWAQRDDDTTAAVTLDSRPEEAEAWQALRAGSCDGCGEPIGGGASVVVRARLYCSLGCALEGERVGEVPGMYLG